MERTARIDNYEFANPERAFEVYADMVYRLSFVRTKNISDSEDILQEVFLRYLKVWEKLESEEHVKAMLIRITINCTNSFLGSVWNRKITQLDENIPYTVCEQRIDVLGEVLKLPLKYRTAVHLHYYLGYSVNEIAEITKTNPATVKTHLKRGREQLKRSIGYEL